MNQLVAIQPTAVPMCLADAEIAAALSFAEAEKSEGTRRAYRSDFGRGSEVAVLGLHRRAASAGPQEPVFGSQDVLWRLIASFEVQSRWG